MNPRPEAPSIGLIHNRAVKLEGLIKAIAYLENEGDPFECQSALIFVAEEIASQLERELDLLNSQPDPAIVPHSM